uniref:Uncharacterized protein n=1 Tax=Micrurus lemniscatus lemniscatus TaxID=129467 RepID=A0A2D4I183_MICLE
MKRGGGAYKRNLQLLNIQLNALYTYLLNYLVLSYLLLCCLMIGVPRETQEEKDFADFDIFDDPDSPFSTFNFKYSNEAFNRLHDLMEFNTLNNLDVIKEVITDSIEYRRQNPSRCSVSLSNVEARRYFNKAKSNNPT